MIWVKCSHRATVAKLEEKTEMVADFAIRAEKKKHKSVTSYDFMSIRQSHNKLLPSFTNTVTSKRLNKVNLSLSFRFGFLQNFNLHLFKHVKKIGCKKRITPNFASASLHPLRWLSRRRWDTARGETYSWKSCDLSRRWWAGLSLPEFTHGINMYFFKPSPRGLALGFPDDLRPHTKNIEQLGVASQHDNIRQAIRMLQCWRSQNGTPTATNPCPSSSFTSSSPIAVHPASMHHTLPAISHAPAWLEARPVLQAQSFPSINGDDGFPGRYQGHSTLEALNGQHLKRLKDPNS